MSFHVQILREAYQDDERYWLVRCSGQIPLAQIRFLEPSAESRAGVGPYPPQETGWVFHCTSEGISCGYKPMPPPSLDALPGPKENYMFATLTSVFDEAYRQIKSLRHHVRKDDPDLSYVPPSSGCPGEIMRGPDVAQQESSAEHHSL